MQAPPYGIVARALIDRVIDGDTVDVLCGRIKIRIRLLACYAPETRGAERNLGAASKKFLEKRLPKNKPVKVQIPTTEASQLGDVLSLDRVLGHIWDGDQSISAMMVEAGHARAEK